MASKKEMVAMYGPAFDDSGDIVNRNVPKHDVQAYRNAGYEIGSVVEKSKAVVESKVKAKK